MVQAVIARAAGWRPALARPRATAFDRRHALVAPAMVLGFLVRFAPLAGASFPLNDGGLFAQSRRPARERLRSARLQLVQRRDRAVRLPAARLLPDRADLGAAEHRRGEGDADPAASRLHVDDRGVLPARSPHARLDAGGRARAADLRAAAARLPLGEHGRGHHPLARPAVRGAGDRVPLRPLCAQRAAVAGAGDRADHAGGAVAPGDGLVHRVQRRALPRVPPRAPAREAGAHGHPGRRHHRAELAVVGERARPARPRAVPRRRADRGLVVGDPDPPARVRLHRGARSSTSSACSP